MRGSAFDSNIVIDATHGHTLALEILQRSVDPAISVVTWMEVMAGTTIGRDEAEIRAFLVRFKLFPITDAVTEESVRVRRGSKIKLMDAIILATARVHG